MTWDQRRQHEDAIWNVEQNRIDPPEYEDVDEDDHGEGCRCKECDPDFWNDLAREERDADSLR